MGRGSLLPSDAGDRSHRLALGLPRPVKYRSTAPCPKSGGHWRDRSRPHECTPKRRNGASTVSKVSTMCLRGTRSAPRNVCISLRVASDVCIFAPRLSKNPLRTLGGTETETSGVGGCKLARLPPHKPPEPGKIRLPGALSRTHATHARQGGTGNSFELARVEKAPRDP